MQALARIRYVALALLLPIATSAQTRTAVPARPAAQSAGTLVIAGQQDQAPLVRINGRPYIDIESLARLTHATVRYTGSQVILTFPNGSQLTQAAETSAQSARGPQLSGAFLAAEIETLTAIREWRVSLVNAVQNNYPVADNWIAPLRRFADSKLQLAAAAASTEPDQQTLELLRNEFTNMQQESDGLLAMRAKISYIRPDTFDNNTLDQKILTCQRALAQVAASKQFQDDPACH
jgi:hypothetical protein